MKKYMRDIFKRLEDGILIHADSMQMALEIKALEKTIEDMAVTIHVHEKTLDEYAATVLTRDKRIAVLEARIEELETPYAQRTSQVRDATLKRLQRGV